MGFLKPNPPRVSVEVVQTTHGQTFVTWPSHVIGSGDPLPELPLGGTHPRSRHWVMADRTAILILPADPSEYEGGVSRHTFEVVSSSWNRRTKTLSSLVVHPDDQQVTFGISTSGVGCACTQGAAGNAGPINEPYQIVMVNQNDSEFDWFTAVTP